MSSNTTWRRSWERFLRQNERVYPYRRHFGNGVLGDITEPKDDEKRRYYRGLAGLPRLIARTSTDTWDGSDTTGRDPKTVSIIGNHPIVQIWCPELRAKIISVLNGTLDWEVFYIIRVGREQDPLYSYPVVLMIGLRNDGPQLPIWRDMYARETERGGYTIQLEPRTDAEIAVETNGWLMALRAALRCRQLLRDYGIEDVEHIAVAATHLWSQASRDFSCQMEWSFSRFVYNLQEPTRRDLALAEVSGTAMPLLSYPGGCIEQEPLSSGRNGGLTDEAQAKTGTLGFYLRLRPAVGNTRPGSSSGSVYALTSRHAAIACRAALDKGISEPRNNSQSDDHNDGASNMTLRIYSGGARSRTLCLLSLKYALDGLKAYFQDFEYRLVQHSKDEEVVAQVAAHNGTLAYCAKLQAAIRHTQNQNQSQKQSQNQSQDQDQNLADRYFGTVAYSPCHRIDSHGHFSDWALIRLDDNVGSGSSYENKVYLSSNSTRIALYEAGLICQRALYRDNRSNLRSKKDITLDQHGFVHLHTRDLPAQPYFAVDPVNRAPYLVVKRGAETGLRFGQTNERKRLMVLGFKDEEHRYLSNLNLRFADPRDAGACVFDTEGRIVGVVEPELYAKDVLRHFDKVRAAGTRDEPCCSDITFVTPIQWILEDIKQFTGMEPVVV